MSPMHTTLPSDPAHARRHLVPLCLVGAALLGGCATGKNSAPVEERVVGARAATTAPAPPPVVPAAPVGAVTSPVAAAVPADPSKPALGLENLGKPGYYQVKPGETLIRIALENGQNWKDLVRWNNLDNPNVIEVGQVLRVVAPGGGDGAASARPVGAPRAAAPAASAPAPAAAAPAVAPVATRDADDDVVWQWPAVGNVASAFEEGRTKGLAIVGKAGDPVLAAAEGRVVYAGSGLRGYGNLVILKHNTTWLTAYAHNQALLVKEDQNVKRGQKIAEMGSSDAERVQLHFEIRKQGKPVDPARLLPPR